LLLLCLLASSISCCLTRGSSLPPEQSSRFGGWLPGPRQYLRESIRGTESNRTNVGRFEICLPRHIRLAFPCGLAGRYLPVVARSHPLLRRDSLTALSPWGTQLETTRRNTRETCAKPRPANSLSASRWAHANLNCHRTIPCWIP